MDIFTLTKTVLLIKKYAFSQCFDRQDITHFLGDYKGAGAVSVPAKNGYVTRSCSAHTS